MSNWYTNTATIGGGNGRNPVFNEVRLPLVKTLNVWSDSNCILALGLVWTNGQTATIGNPRSSQQSITFASGELITSMIMMKTDGRGTAGNQMVGQIRITTNKGQNVAFGPGGTWTYTLVTGTGLLCGFQGQQGVGIYQLCASFLANVKSVNIQVVDDDLWRQPLNKSTQISQVTLTGQVFTNNSTKPIQWDWNGSVSVSDTSTFSQTAAETFGMSAEVSADLFEVASVKSGFEWSIESSTTQGSSKTTTLTVGNQVSGTLQPGQTVHASTVSQQGSLTLNYNSVVTITFQDPSVPEQKFNESGTFRNSLFVAGQTVVKDGN